MGFQRSLSIVFIGLVAFILLGGCSELAQPPLATPLPPEYMPTAVALTLQASGIDLITLSPSVSSPPASASSSADGVTIVTVLPATDASLPTQAAPTNALATAVPGPVFTATLKPPPLTPSPTPGPEIPDARIQIYRIGERSLVISPIEITTRLTSHTGKVVRFELYGEDGRLLARDVRTFSTVPWNEAKLALDLQFEISAAAEEGRLVISVEDKFGRITDVNSLNLILLSQGITELNPPTALLQRLVIQEPEPKALIQGGKLIASGRALPNQNQPLKVLLITEEGKILGQRLAGIEFPIPGDFGNFIAEVPYTVTELTPALLVVMEDGGVISQISHLASQEVILAP